MFGNRSRGRSGKRSASVGLGRTGVSRRQHILQIAPAPGGGVLALRLFMGRRRRALLQMALERHIVMQRRVFQIGQCIFSGSAQYLRLSHDCCALRSVLLVVDDAFFELFLGILQTFSECGRCWICRQKQYITDGGQVGGGFWCRVRAILGCF
ncbi:hypothetical protein [Janthinobacterium agaricidamnosum]|uniref:hypothetical protein n=1 Tax=Janthinobacterium agaricidamnosum TaxID=55508 RepID=UPI0012E724AA|nr:hypothetical protein [Janthinobacterium agaricidamnosum]